MLKSGKCASEKALPMQASCLLKDVYAGASGEPKDQAIDAFGEVTPEGVEQLLGIFPTGNLMNKDDVFLDIGAGIGKLAMQVFLTTPCQRALGVELADFRYRQSQQAMVLLQRMGTEAKVGSSLDAGESHVSFAMEGRELKFERGDLLNFDMKEATVVFAADLAFPADLHRALVSKLISSLRPGTLVILMTKLAGCSRGLLLLTKASIKVSWGEAGIYIYMVTTPAEEAELMASDKSIVQKVGTKKWGGKDAQLRRLRKVLADEPLVMAHHRERGDKRSTVHCDAHELISAAEQGMDAVNALLDTGSIDLSKRDEKNVDILRYLIDEQGIVANAKKIPNEEFQKAQEEKAELLMKLVNRVVQVRAGKNRSPRGKVEL